jgi:hypothetical protein
MATTTLPMSVLLEAYKALVIAERELMPVSNSSAFYPVMSARCALEARLGALPCVAITDPQPLNKETPQ